MKYRFALLSFVLVFATMGVGTPNLRPESIRIDCSTPAGSLKGLHGHFTGQGATLLEPARQKAHMADMGVSLFRIWLLQPHDFFSGKTLEDARNPDHYDFSQMDTVAARAEAMGIELFPILATTPAQLSMDGTHKGAPTELEVYVEVIRHVILHLTQGWGDGHHYRIRYWEIGNEPDISEVRGPLGGFFWTGTRQQFFEMYAALAKTIKSIKAPSAIGEYKVGGPAIMRLELWGKPFLEYCNKNELPLDFFSFHKYADDPEEFARLAERAEQLVRKFPRYRDTELILNEWNMATPFNEVDKKGKTPIEIIFQVLAHPKFFSPQSGIHMARSLIVMERSPLSKAGHCSLADNGRSQMGVVTFPEITFPPSLALPPSGSTMRKPPRTKLKYHVLRTFQMLGQTPDLIQIQAQQDQLDGLAGISRDRDRVTVLLVNWGGDREADLEMIDLPWSVAKQPKQPGVTYEWTEFNLDVHATGAGDPLQQVATGIGRGSTFRRKLTVSKDSIVVLRLMRR